MTQAKLFTPEQAAGLLELSARQVRRLALTHGIGFRVAGCWLFKRADIARMRKRNGRGRPKKCSTMPLGSKSKGL